MAAAAGTVLLRRDLGGGGGLGLGWGGGRVRHVENRAVREVDVVVLVFDEVQQRREGEGQKPTPKTVQEDTYRGWANSWHARATLPQARAGGQAG